VEADEKIKRVDIEERQSSLLSPSPSLFPTIIFDIVCYFCGIFVTKSGGCSRFSARPSLLCSAVQTASVRVDTPRIKTNIISRHDVIFVEACYPVTDIFRD